MNRFRHLKLGLWILMVISVPMASGEPLSIPQEMNYPQAAQPEQTVINPMRLKVTQQNEARGIASWYSESDPGINKHTSNGEIFDEQKMTCASWHHEFGTLLKVTNLKNGKSVVCRVNDRGPNKRLGRLVDLTISAFHRIADPRTGLVKVSVKRVG